MDSLKVLLMLAVFIFSQCTRQDDVLSGYLEHDAVLVYQKPADGCDWHFVLEVDEDIEQLAASESSQAIGNKFLEGHNIFDRLNVRITYKHTGKEKEVICGWGTTTKMPEIDLAAINKR